MPAWLRQRRDVDPGDELPRTADAETGRSVEVEKQRHGAFEGFEPTAMARDASKVDSKGDRPPRGRTRATRGYEVGGCISHYVDEEEYGGENDPLPVQKPVRVDTAES